MGLLVNIVAATEEEIEDVGASLQPVAEWSGIELRDVDTGKLVTLHSLLTGEGLDEASYAYEPVFVAGDEGPWVLRLPDELSNRLAELEEEALDEVSAELAATEEFELADWPQEEVQSLVEQLADLARLADSQEQVLLVWMHPLRT